MDTWKRMITLGKMAAVMGLVACASLAAAQSGGENAKWENSSQLAPGQRIRVVLNDAKTYEGKWQSMTDEAIVVRLETGDQSFARQNVLRVSTKGTSHRGRNVLIGLAIGAGAGVIVGVASPEFGQGTCAQGSCVNAASVGLGGFLGGALGTGIGAAIPTGGWHGVYHAPERDVASAH